MCAYEPSSQTWQCECRSESVQYPFSKETTQNFPCILARMRETAGRVHPKEIRQDPAAWAAAEDTD